MRAVRRSIVGAQAPACGCSPEQAHKHEGAGPDGAQPGGRQSRRGRQGRGVARARPAREAAR
jgi:hypothetical protein